MRKLGLALFTFAAFSVAQAADYVVGDMKDAEGNTQHGKFDNSFDHSVGFIPPADDQQNQDKANGMQLEGLDLKVHEFQGGPFDGDRVISIEGKEKQNDKAKEDAAKAADTKAKAAEVVKEPTKQ
ncbi:MAG: hypothetical protein EB060_07010 [Proteobacteria bacterium]|nr:hypothetical protein [Pseudomonadota bacterium]